jgi:hypothetical protein
MKFMETVQQTLARQAVVEVILAALQDVLAGAASEPVTPDENTRLIGRSSVLDSMGLVTLIARGRAAPGRRPRPRRRPGRRPRHVADAQPFSARSAHAGRLRRCELAAENTQG